MADFTVGHAAAEVMLECRMADFPFPAKSCRTSLCAGAGRPMPPDSYVLPKGPKDVAYQ